MKLGNIRGVVVDFDGTVINTLAAIYHAVKDTLVAGGILRSLDLPTFLQTCHQPFSAYLLWLGVKKVDQELIDYYCQQEEFYRQRFKPRLCVGAPEFLDHLAQLNIPRMIVSARRVNTIWAELNRLGVHDNFCRILGHQDNKSGAILKCCRYLRCRPDQVVYIGDMAGDMEDATAVGVPAIGYSEYPHITETRLKKAGAKIVVSDHRDLIPLLSAA